MVETRHELCGISLKDKILVFSGAKGSSGWSQYFHLARLAGTAPKAVLYNRTTTKVALGAVVMRVPAVTDFDRDPLEIIETGDENVEFRQFNRGLPDELRDAGLGGHIGRADIDFGLGRSGVATGPKRASLFSEPRRWAHRLAERRTS